MALKTIVKLPNSVLKQGAREIAAGEIASVRIRKLIADMKDTLKSAADGVGLAAPQVGESLQLFLVSEEADFVGKKAKSGESEDVEESKARKETWQQFVFINPKVVRNSRKKVEMAEGCLSIPGKFGLVPRFEKLTITWLDESGKKHNRGFSGFFARVIQHEMDHLNGQLFISRAKKVFDIDKSSHIAAGV